MVKKIFIGAMVIVLLLVATLAIHIYMVTGAKANTGPNWTMSKIEIPQNLDKEQGDALKTELMAMEGVRSVRTNLPMGHIICLYDRKLYSGQELVDVIEEKWSFQASLYQPSAEELASSCPAIAKDSFTYQVGSFFQTLFTN